MTRKRTEVSSVAVVIPIYTVDLTASEQASLTQCMLVLRRYAIRIVKPESLDLSAITRQYPSIELVNFDDQYFKGTEGYNKLMTSSLFYERFSGFEYMLIYQLDAYVFRDELLDWCDRGFDYIGAPSLHQPEFDCLPVEKRQEFAEALSNHRIVFNGGLSLRKIPAFLRYLKIYNTFYPAWKGNEDMLYSQEATRLVPMKMFMKLPTWQEALRFAFEKSPAATYELTGRQLPFACHAWERYDPAFWKPFIVVNQ